MTAEEWPQYSRTVRNTRSDQDIDPFPKGRGPMKVTMLPSRLRLARNSPISPRRINQCEAPSHKKRFHRNEFCERRLPY